MGNIEFGINIFLIILAVLVVVEIFANLISVRNNKCKKEEVRKKLNISRTLIIVVLLIYVIYGIFRNII